MLRDFSLGNRRKFLNGQEKESIWTNERDLRVYLDRGVDFISQNCKSADFFGNNFIWTIKRRLLFLQKKRLLFGQEEIFISTKEEIIIWTIKRRFLFLQKTRFLVGQEEEIFNFVQLERRYFPRKSQLSIILK